MNQFQVNVDRLEESPLELEIDASAQEMELEDIGHTFPERIRGELEFSVAGRDVRGVGSLRTVAQAACARCLEPVKVPLDVPIDAMWLWKNPNEDERYHSLAESIMAEYYKGDFVDTRNTLRELILAALPLIEYCKPDCKGLCPGCGANLNHEPCRCGEEGRKRGDDLPEWKKKLLELKKPTAG